MSKNEGQYKIESEEEQYDDGTVNIDFKDQKWEYLEEEAKENITLLVKFQSVIPELIKLDPSLADTKQKQEKVQGIVQTCSDIGKDLRNTISRHSNIKNISNGQTPVYKQGELESEDELYEFLNIYAQYAGIKETIATTVAISIQKMLAESKVDKNDVITELDTVIKQGKKDIAESAKNENKQK